MLARHAIPVRHANPEKITANVMLFHTRASPPNLHGIYQPAR